MIEILIILHRIKPDIIHGHSTEHFGILAGLYQRLMGFHPVVISPLGTDVLEARGGRCCLRRFALLRADCVVLYGEVLREKLLNFGVHPTNIHLFYNGVDTHKFSPDRRSQLLREHLGIFDSPMVICLRALQAIYDGESIIRAIPAVQREIPNVKFVITGRGKDEGKLRRLAGSLGVSHNVKFVGQLGYDEMPTYLASADLYVSTSLQDGGFSLAAKEAMSCGLPVIVTNFGENAKWVKDNINGFIVPMRNPGTLAMKIIEILQKPEELLRMGSANRRLVEDHLSMQHEKNEITKIEGIFINLIERFKN